MDDHSSRVDAIFDEYEAILKNVYEQRTAGDYTFLGILAEFTRKLSEAEFMDRYDRTTPVLVMPKTDPETPQHERRVQRESEPLTPRAKQWCKHGYPEGHPHFEAGLCVLTAVNPSEQEQ